MAGIYLHIPYCKQACTYCNFHFSTHTKSLHELIQSMLREIELRHTFLDSETIETIYFGGGTPSLLPSELLAELMNHLKNHFALSNNLEITLEANPDDIDLTNLENWLGLGFNRLSVGVQSFRDQDLIWMNRSHRSQQAQNAIKLARSAGFHNINLDLIYALPNLTDQDWISNIQQAIDLGITHLSSYSLTVEEKTKLNHLIKKGEMPQEDEDQSARQFEILMKQTFMAGFEHYEISNFSKPGFHSKHNSSYWNRQPYIGFGPSAHSFKNNVRQWNISSNSAYIQSLQKGFPNLQEEILTKKEIANELIMTGLRTKKGFHQNQIIELQLPEWHRWQIQLDKEVQKGLIDNQNGLITLTHTGKFLADEIASNLFFI
ncbi:MAG: radical SAM family heme chaperone HemW [Bacteroidia bacterium]|nr:radical SAM family heme chaperone HemW [Bacteroidia bacterium]